MKESRLFRIIYHLMENGKSTAPELAEKLEVSVRTVYRDIDIISSAGVPIYVTTGRNGGIQIADSFVLDRLLLSDKEKEDIITALRSVLLWMIITVIHYQSYQRFLIQKVKTGLRLTFHAGGINRKIILCFKR
ncbi:HTH domain-containing protein [Thomasclavelia spiroformis]|uniref:helix-turn-helix transcriptional regulator n=1 Tax=Thomasclavelia spiroformis TaxID=29348 RepID=UPI0029435F79|nr:HTH domain-containing protein [Thomasclavelia spiroformis]